MDEADQKKHELSTIQNRLMDISMDLRANMQKQRPSSDLKTGELGQHKASSSTCGNSNEGVLPEGGAVSGPSHGGSYVDKGTPYIRIKLPPCVVSGECLSSALCVLVCLLFTCT